MRYIRQTIEAFFDDDCMTMAAAIAYYALFSLPPLLLIVASVAGVFFSRAAVQQELSLQIELLTGPSAARHAREMMDAVAADSAGGWFPAIIGIAALVFAATTVFAQLQASLNRAWGVRPGPRTSGLRNFIGKRLLSFALILGIGFLLLVSLTLSAAIAAFGGVLVKYLPGWMSEPVLYWISTLGSFALFTLLFAAIFKILPDAVIAWRDVWFGALLTTLLLVVGKSLVGFYLGHSDIASKYGAAATLVILLLWTYYSANIFLLGAEFTHVWARTRGKGVRAASEAPASRA